MIKFYHRFLLGAAQVLTPLYTAITSCPGRQQLEWTNEMVVSFYQARELLANAASLAFIHADAELFLAVDASNIAIGATLYKAADSVTREPLAFFSRKLSKSQRTYSAFNQEVLVARSAVIHFHHILQGRQFALLTDHKPLVAALEKRSDPESSLQSWYLSKVSKYTLDIRHLLGTVNQEAHCLSRLGPELSPPIELAEISDIDFSEMATEQQDDEWVQDYIRTYQYNVRLTANPHSATPLWCNVSRTRLPTSKGCLQRTSPGQPISGSAGPFPSNP